MGHPKPCIIRRIIMKHSAHNAGQRSQAVWGATPAGAAHALDKTVGTKEYFETVLKARFTDEHYWLAEFVDYPAWQYKKVLEVGCGAGYDAYMFCKNGADYTGIDITPENSVRTKKHLSYYNLHGTIMQMDATALNFQEKFDLIYSFGVLHHIPDMSLVLKNIYNRLADDGSFYLVVYNKNSIFYRLTLVMSWLREGYFLKESFKKRLARIESTDSSELPHIDVYSKKNINKILEQAGFKVITTEVHQLDQHHMPHMFKLSWIWSRIPRHWYTFFGRYCGWYIAIKAQKIPK